MKWVVISVVVLSLTGCRTPETDARQMRRKMERTTIPIVNFREARVSDLLEFIEDNWVTTFPDEPSGPRPVSIILELPDEVGPTMTIYGKNMTWLTLIETVAEEVGCEYVISGSGVTFVTNKTQRVQQVGIDVIPEGHDLSSGSTAAGGEGED